MADPVSWHLSGDYFENCSCNVVCPCLVSPAAPLTVRPTEGFCNVPLIFHIESGRYGDVALANIGHPVNADRMALAVGAAGNTFSGHGMRWDNSGKNGLYASIRWSNLS